MNIHSIVATDSLSLPLDPYKLWWPGKVFKITIELSFEQVAMPGDDTPRGRKHEHRLRARKQDPHWEESGSLTFNRSISSKNKKRASF